MNFMEAALDGARRGFRVFPLRPNDKRPLIKDWQRLATQDVAQIRRWWEEIPDANIGYITGQLLVVDVDAGRGGFESFLELANQQPFDKTARTKTQSGGLHAIYAMPPGEHVRGGVDRLAPGVDIKGLGGYIVAPGSVVKGRPYQWENEQPVAPAPRWLIEKCGIAKPKSNAAGKRLVEEDETAIEMAQDWLDRYGPEASAGQRDDVAFRVAARLFDFGVSKLTALELLADWNFNRCFPQLGAADLSRIVDSASKNRREPIGAQHPDASGFEAADASSGNAESAPLPRFGYVSFNEGADRALTEAAEPLIEGLIDCGTMSIIYGESNSGKSFTEMDKDFHIAAGKEWAGKKVKQGAVVWVAAEGGIGVYKRLAALRKHYGVTAEIPFFAVVYPVDLRRSDADLKPLLAIIAEIESTKQVKVVKVTIDTLSRVIAGGDENSPVDMGLLVRHFDAIRTRTGAHVAIVHHTGKNLAKGARGHSLLRAATDTEIEIHEKRIKVTKQRDLDSKSQGLDFSLKSVALGKDVRGNEVTSCVVSVSNGSGFENEEDAPNLTPTEERVFDLIKKRGLPSPFRWQDVATICRDFDPDKKWERSTVVGILSGLVSEKAVKKVKENQYVL